MMRTYFLALATLMVVCVGCTVDSYDRSHGSLIDKQFYNAPPAAMLARPGPMTDGPGPGVLPMSFEEPVRSFAAQTTQISFLGPEGSAIGWQIGEGFADRQLMCPAKYNFQQNYTYRLKISEIPDRPEMVLYPTLQVYPSHPKTDAYLSHANVPILLTDEDLDQIAANNFVTKVVYLPDPENQDLAIAVETLVSTRLDPGVDPVAEADRRGTIMAVLRCGNMNYEMKQSGNGGTTPVVYLDGDNGEHAEPQPIGGIGAGSGVPQPMMMGLPGAPGMPARHAISGVGGTPVWGMTMTGTPIGLPGPPHLPYGGPAGLQSHTVRNRTKTHLARPVDHFLLDVQQKPGIYMPDPVRHVEYTEKHPQFVRPVMTDGYCPDGYCPPN